MNKMSLIVATLFLSSCCHVSVSENQRDIKSTVFLSTVKTLKFTGKLAEKFKDVKIKSTCSGVAISTHNVLTAAHCASTLLPTSLSDLGVTVDDVKMKFLNFSGSVVCEATLEKIDKENDLALLKTDCDLKNIAAVASRDAEAGSEVTNIGYPDGVTFPVLTSGFVTVTFDDSVPAVGGRQLVSAPVVGGSSGSPVFQDGRIVGIVSMAHEGYEHMAFIVSATTIKKFLSR